MKTSRNVVISLFCITLFFALISLVSPIKSEPKAYSTLVDSFSLSRFRQEPWVYPGVTTCPVDFTYKKNLYVEGTIYQGGSTIGGTTTTVKEGGSAVGDADIQTLDFLGADFVISESPDTEINISLDYTNGSIVLDDQTLEVEGEGTATRLFKLVNGENAARTLTYNENFTIGDGHAGTLTFSVASKVLTVETTNTLDQSVASGATPTFSATNFSDGGSNAIITTTQETNFGTAYTHSQDNTQAHTDYLLNSGNDSTSGFLTAAGFVSTAKTTATPSASFTVNWTTNLVHQVTITGTTLDITFTNPSGPCFCTLVVIQGDGDDTIDWSNEADIKWPGGVAPTLSTGAVDVDITRFYFDGTSYYGLVNLDFQ